MRIVLIYYYYINLGLSFANDHGNITKPATSMKIIYMILCCEFQFEMSNLNKYLYLAMQYIYMMTMMTTLRLFIHNSLCRDGCSMSKVTGPSNYTLGVIRGRRNRNNQVS